MKREHGFYWVKRQLVFHGPPLYEKLVWEVAKYEYGSWYLADGSTVRWDDYSFLEIDERKLIRIE